MASAEGRDLRWLRPLGLFALVLGLSVGQPLLLVAVPFGLLSFLQPSGRTRALLVGALVLGFAFGNFGAGASWYLERGWIVIVAGWFVAITLARPARPFMPRGLVAVAGAVIWTGALLLTFEGWTRLEALIRGRIEESAATTLELSRALGTAAAGDSALIEAVERTAAAQVTVFPALAGLATLAGLGVAWWLHVRVGTGSSQGLGAWKNLRFSDGMVWLFIAGLVLGLTMGWTEGWGRVGTNLLLFSGALYMLRGAGVLLFLSGGPGWFGWTLAALATVLAAPVVLGGTLVVGLADTWFDLRAAPTGAKDANRDSQGDDGT